MPLAETHTMNKESDNDIKKDLIDELETLHDSLDKVDVSERSAAVKPRNEDDIPVLRDIIHSDSAISEASGDPVSSIYKLTLRKEKAKKIVVADNSLIPTLYPENYLENKRAEKIIDELVAEYLPLIEAQLREKLRKQYAPSAATPSNSH